MKTILLRLTLLVIFTLFFTGCTPDDPIEPIQTEVNADGGSTGTGEPVIPPGPKI